MIDWRRLARDGLIARWLRTVVVLLMAVALASPLAAMDRPPAASPVLVGVDAPVLAVLQPASLALRIDHRLPEPPSGPGIGNVVPVSVPPVPAGEVAPRAVGAITLAPLRHDCRPASQGPPPAA